MPKVEELSREFLAALDNLEFQYITYFLFREPRMQEDSMDKLKNHYWFAFEKGTAIFGFVRESDLPKDIRIKCLANFAHYFPDGYIYGDNF